MGSWVSVNHTINCPERGKEKMQVLFKQARYFVDDYLRYRSLEKNNNVDKWGRKKITVSSYCTSA